MLNHAIHFKAIMSLILFMVISHAVANTLPKNNPIPGGIALVPLEVESPTKPKAYFNNNQVMVMENPKSAGQWVAVAGIPLGNEPGTNILEVEISNKKIEVPFMVQQFDYESQYITLKNKRKVNPYKKDLERIKKEKKEIVSALSHWRDSDQPLEEFTLPVKGRLSSPFGLRRFFNKQPRKPHSGIDIAAPEGTPIVSPLAATVMITGDYFFNGNTVFLDHGNGLVTMYCHMSKIKVKPGQKVAKGEAIGAIGKTGRVTGPHLHWGVSLNDARVDPSLFFQDLDKLLTHKKKKK